MKIYSWNINGIRATLRDNLFFSFIKQEDPDILCLQETKAQPGEAIIDLPQYHEFWNSAEKKGYSGTAIFSKTEPIQIVNGFPDDIITKFQITGDEYGDPHKEGRLQTAEFEKFYLVTAYIPNSKRGLTRLKMREKHWDPALLAYCKNLEKQKPVILCGDFNVAHTELDLANPKANKKNPGFTAEERAGFQAFIDAGYVDTLRLFKKGGGYYTWWSHFANARERNVGWRIDYFLVSKTLKNKVKSAETHSQIFGSDHCPVSITIEI